MCNYKIESNMSLSYAPHKRCFFACFVGGVGKASEQMLQTDAKSSL